MVGSYSKSGSDAITHLARVATRHPEAAFRLNTGLAPSSYVRNGREMVAGVKAKGKARERPIKEKRSLVGRFSYEGNEVGVVVPAGEEVGIGTDGEDRYGMGGMCVSRPTDMSFAVEQRDAGFA